MLALSQWAPQIALPAGDLLAVRLLFSRLPQRVSGTSLTMTADEEAVKEQVNSAYPTA